MTKHKAAHRAHNKLLRAIKRGAVYPAYYLSCADCSYAPSEYHHYAGYRFWWKAVPLCRFCHRREHLKTIVIRSVHKNALLALRHASQLSREFDGDVTFKRFNRAGRFSSRGTNYTFVIKPKPRKMWRIIVGYPYLQNKKKGSPDSRTMKAIFYGTTKQSVVDEKSRLRKDAKHEISKISKAWTQEKRSHPLYRKVNVSISQVEYDVRLIGLTSYLDD